MTEDPNGDNKDTEKPNDRRQVVVGRRKRYTRSISMQGREDCCMRISLQSVDQGAEDVHVDVHVDVHGHGHDEYVNDS